MFIGLKPFTEHARQIFSWISTSPSRMIFPIGAKTTYSIETSSLSNLFRKPEFILNHYPTYTWQDRRSPFPTNTWIKFNIYMSCKKEKSLFCASCNVDAMIVLIYISNQKRQSHSCTVVYDNNKIFNLRLCDFDDFPIQCILKKISLLYPFVSFCFWVKKKKISLTRLLSRWLCMIVRPRDVVLMRLGRKSSKSRSIL